MTSPIERKPNNDKTIMPLRGEGNQLPKTGIDFDLSSQWFDIINGVVVGGGETGCVIGVGRPTEASKEGYRLI